MAERNKTVKHVESCPDCDALAALYSPDRVRRIIRRIMKRATWPGIAEEIIAAIEKQRSKHECD